MQVKQRILFFILTGICFFIACSKDPLITGDIESRPVLPGQPFDYTTTNFPSYFNAPPLSYISSIQSTNPITNDGATLGRVLFYDKHFSVNNNISCGSCHHQENGFSDPKPLSRGSEGGFTTRNSIALENTRFSYSFFWDMRAVFVEQQVLIPIQNHVEMDQNLDQLVIKLKALDYYPDLFQKAFGSAEITSDKISKALAQFVQSLTSYRSKYDTGKQTGFSNFTAEETTGMNLFFGAGVHCSQCHATDNFYNTEMLNNGLDSVYADNGQGTITGNAADNGKFKVPSLRNIEVSAPYMHDGRFSTLDEVIEHYNSGVKQHPNLDSRLTTTGTTGGPPKQFLLTASDKSALVAFLKTLTDHPFLTDARFSNPFQ